MMRRKIMRRKMTGEQVMKRIHDALDGLDAVQLVAVHNDIAQGNLYWAGCLTDRRKQAEGLPCEDAYILHVKETDDD